MKVLITGSNGLLGQHLIPVFLEDGRYQVIASGRGPNRLPMQTGYTYEATNLRDATSVRHLLEKHQPDILIHAAAMTQVDDCERNKDLCWDTNVAATRYLLQAAEKHNTFFIFLSTDFVFDGLQGPYAEEDAVNPISYYGSSKVAAESMVRNSKLPWAIVRTVLVYGVAADPKRSNIITWVKNNLEQGKKLKVVDDQWRTPTLVQDLAVGCKLVADKKATGIFHISGKETLTPYQMAVQTAGYFKLNTQLLEKVDAKSFTQPAKRPAKTGFVIDKAVKELGFAPHSFEEGLEIVAKEI
ncbi:SDR family oxidoreductase [Chitinophaga filiformis]|uniref:SDR family oxidoreductase n=1 Tax=Chitinophaga filiformis TaxID=104663 RepID=UPI001F41B2FE|nr:SDR family oxidoreductase [Chitinophaga filiformis]MCF6402733.1 SDR family oxidoreductase [Chitinophaga filiformis]MCF6403349.1 SDR family oxidoreductase [Chitinophaga filiformis]